MTQFVNLLTLLAVAAVGVAASLVLPGMLGVPLWLVALLALTALVVTLAGLAGWGLARIERRLRQLEASVAQVTARTDVLRQDLQTLETETGAADSRSSEMIREMRVLQTLLGQLATRGGGRRGKASSGPASESPAAAEDETLDLDFIIRNAVSENRIDLYLQPTVSLPARRAVHYECFSRVRDPDGRVLYPNEYLPLAESSGLMGTLDNLLLFRCIQLIRKLGHRRPSVRFFCNISESSVADDEFFPQFLDYMRGNRELADRLVFEFSQRDFGNMSRATLRDLGALGEEGFRFAIDQVDDIELDPAALAAEHVNYVKVDVDLLLRDGGPSPRELREALEKHEVTLIATKVETEGQVLDLLDQDIKLAQGYLFGEPRLSRESPGAGQEMHGVS